MSILIFGYMYSSLILLSHVSVKSCNMRWCVCGLQIAGVDYVYFIQKNTLNRKERTLHIESHNETFSNRVIIHETCCYSVSRTHTTAPYSAGCCPKAAYNTHLCIFVVQVAPEGDPWEFF